MNRFALCRANCADDLLAADEVDVEVVYALATLLRGVAQAEGASRWSA
jgi:hypothetical protein